MLARSWLDQDAFASIFATRESDKELAERHGSKPILHAQEDANLIDVPLTPQPGLCSKQVPSTASPSRDVSEF